MNQEVLPDKISGIILIIDDDSISRNMLKKIFQQEYVIEEAVDGKEGLDRILKEPEKYCAIILDVMMPVMDGMETLAVLSEEGIPRRVPIFLITAEGSAAIAKAGYELGAMDIIRKPFVPYAALSRVRSVVELFAARKKLSHIVREQQSELLAQAEKIVEMSRNMIEALATAIEFRSVESGAHVQRIYCITRLMLEHTFFGDGLTKSEIDNIALSSLLHDIGKIATPDAILNKPGRLTAEEFEIMKQHTVQGEKILKRIPQFSHDDKYHYAVDIARHHHERWDGNGYPDRLKGDEIAPWVQVIALADVYDALRSKRVYKGAYTREEAKKMILAGECGVFNPRLLECFFEQERNIDKLYSHLGE